MFYLVYETTNLVNGKFYIGCHITKDPKDSYLGSGRVLKRAIKKYGRDNFKRRVFAFCANETNMLEIERILVSHRTLNKEDCYNRALGGGGSSMTGRRHSEETKKKMSESAKGTVTVEHRANVARALTGRKQPIKTIEKRRATALSQPHLYAIHKGKTWTAIYGKRVWAERT